MRGVPGVSTWELTAPYGYCNHELVLRSSASAATAVVMAAAYVVAGPRQEGNGAVVTQRRWLLGCTGLVAVVQGVVQ